MPVLEVAVFPVPDVATTTGVSTTWMLSLPDRTVFDVYQLHFVSGDKSAGNVVGLSHDLDHAVPVGIDQLRADETVWVVVDMEGGPGGVLVPFAMPYTIAGPQQVLHRNNSGSNAAAAIRLYFSRRTTSLQEWTLIRTRTSFGG